jgi:O-antigen/teichoic acid export membrane protein
LIRSIASRFRRSLLARNTLANTFGQLTQPLLQIVLVPFYVSMLGLDGYGMVTFFTTLTAVLMVFSSGVGWALQREISRREALPDEQKTIPALVRTFEVLYWGAAAAIIAAVVLLAPLITTGWLETKLPAGAVTAALAVIGIRTGLAFPKALYSGVLNATQRQVLNSVIMTVTSLGTAAITVAAIYFWRSIVAYAVADAIAAVLTAMALAVASHRSVVGDVASAPRFERAEVAKLGKLSLSFIWIHGIGVVFKQLDRVIMSKLLPLAALGIYSASTAGGRMLALAYGPFFSAVYPQTCALAARHEQDAFAAHIVRNTKIVLILGCAMAAPLAFFAGDILLAWTRNNEIAVTGAAAMAIYLAGSVLHSANTVLYQGQSAMGDAGPTLQFNTAALLWFPPVLWFLVQWGGVRGGAWSWTIYTGAGWLYLLFKGRGMLRGHMSDYVASWLRIILTSVAVAALMRWGAAEAFGHSLWLRVSCAVAAGVLCLAAGALAGFGLHLSSLRLHPHHTRGAVNQ